MATKSVKADVGDTEFNSRPAPMPNVAGYPQTGTKTAGIKMRGTGAATKGVMSRGPMA